MHNALIPTLTENIFESFTFEMKSFVMTIKCLMAEMFFSTFFIFEKSQKFHGAKSSV